MALRIEEPVTHEHGPRGERNPLGVLEGLLVHRQARGFHRLARIRIDLADRQVAQGAGEAHHAVGPEGLHAVGLQVIAGRDLHRTVSGRRQGDHQALLVLDGPVPLG